MTWKTFFFKRQIKGTPKGKEKFSALFAISQTHSHNTEVGEENSSPGLMTRNLAVSKENYWQRSKYLLFCSLYSPTGWSNNDFYPMGIWDWTSHSHLNPESAFFTFWAHLFWRAEDPRWCLRGCERHCLSWGFTGWLRNWHQACAFQASQHQHSPGGCCPKISAAPCLACSCPSSCCPGGGGMPDTSISPAFKQRSQASIRRFLSWFCNSVGKSEMHSFLERVPKFSAPD